MKKIERESPSRSRSRSIVTHFLFLALFFLHLSSSSEVHAPFTRGDGRNAKARGRR